MKKGSLYANWRKETIPILGILPISARPFPLNGGGILCPFTQIG